MATTTNYGWTTPDDTALVKDGAAAIRTLGSSVDTTTKNLNPSTTLGDIEYRSSTANTNTRLGIGTTNQVLAVIGGVPAWTTISAGGMTLLSTTTLSGASTTISGIDQTYKDLQIVIHGTSNASAAYYPYFRANGSSSNATWAQFYGSNGSGGTQAQLNSQLTFNYGLRSQTNTNNVSVVTIYNYASTTFTKIFDSNSFQISSNPFEESMFAAGLFDTTSAITSFDVLPSTGTYNAGTVLVYGVK